MELVPGQVPGALKPLGSWPQAAASSMEPLALSWGGAGPTAVQSAPAPCPLQEGAQRAFVPGGHHPLAGPSPLAGKPLPAGPQPTRQQFSGLLAPSSELRTTPRSLLPTDGAAQHSAGVPDGRTTSRLPRPRGRPPPGLIINPEAL